MKQLLTGFFVLSCLLISRIATAQNFEPMPPGEGFQSVFEVHDGASTYLVGATLHAFYNIANLSGTPFANEMIRLGPPAILEVTPVVGGTGNTFYMLARDGSVWKLQFQNGALPQPTKLGQFPVTPNEIPISLQGGDNLYIVTTGGHVYVSRDNGSTWSQDESGLNGAFAGDGGNSNYADPVALDASQNVYVATGTGLFKQTKSGTSWTQVAGTASNLSTVFIDKNNNIYAGGPRGYMTVSNSGTVSLTDTVGIGGFGPVTIFTANNGEVYAYVTDTDYTSNSNLWRHDPATRVWKNIDQTINSQFSLDNQSGIPVSAVVSDGPLVISNDYGLFVSSDKGTTWKAIDGAVAEQATGFQKLASGRKIVATNRGIFSKDPNDAAWTKRFPPALYLKDLKLWQDKNETLYAKDSEGLGVFKSMDKGLTWAYDTAGLFPFDDSIGSVGSAGFLVDENGNQHMTIMSESLNAINYVRNSGATVWSPDTATYKPNDNAEMGSFYSDHRGGLYYLDRSDVNRLVRRDINGGAWTPLIGPIPAGKVFDVAFVKGAPILATDHGLLTGQANIAWVAIPPPTSLKPDQTNAFALSLDSDGIGWAAFGTTVDSENYVTTDLFRMTDKNTLPAGLQGYYMTDIQSFGDTTYALTDAGIAKFVAHAPGYLTLSVNTLDFGTIDTNKTASADIVVRNPSDRPVTVDSAYISGPDKASFVISHAGGTIPYIIPVGGSVTYTLTFSAGAPPAATKNAMLTIKFDEKTDSLRQAILTGKSHVNTNGVSPAALTALNVSIVPNPFHGLTTVHVAYEKATSGHIEVRDILGRTIYTSETVKTDAGGSHAFIFAPDRLSLPSGVYSIAVFADKNEVSRQVVYLK